jgi:DNA-binding MarR family transcriptional regulator
MNTREIRRFRKALRQFQRLAGAQFKSCSCSVTLAQCLVLLEIDEHEPLTMGELAAKLKLDHSTLSRTVDGLVRKKLLQRLEDEHDRRKVRIRLTGEGRSLCREIHEGNDEYCRQVFARIQPSDWSAVIRHFEILVQAYLDFAGQSDPATKRA